MIFMCVCVGVDKLILIFIWIGKETRVAKIILKRKKNKVKGISLPDNNTYYIAIVIKIVELAEGQINLSLKQNRYPVIHLHKHEQVIFNKGTKAIQQKKGNLFHK